MAMGGQQIILHLRIHFMTLKAKSPLYKFYKKKNSLALLIGVNLNVCSVMHVAENIADINYLYKNNCKVLLLIKIKESL